MTMQAREKKPRIRLFVDAPLHVGESVALTEAQAHYLTHVMRLPEGESVALFNGREGEFLAGVRRLGKRGGEAQVQHVLRPQSNSPDIWLAFAPIKHGKIDFIAQKATELGVSALLPVITRHTSVSRVNTERLRANAVEAAEQCERLDVPDVQEPQKLESLLADWPQERLMIYGDESGQGHSARELLSTLKPGPAAVLIGPEGGFAPQEQAMIRTLASARAMCMGPRILRADTAALSALACVQAWLGDWDEKPAFVAEK